MTSRRSLRSRGQAPGTWRREARAGRRESDPYRGEGVEHLTYNNPYASEVERVWFDEKIVYALDCGEVELDFDEQRVARGNAVAQKSPYEDDPGFP